jgi:hypothetical protein
VGNRLKPRRDLLVGFPQQLHKIANDVLVAAVEEGSGDTSVAGTTGTTDAMDVIVDVTGEIIVDDVGDVGDVQTTGGDSGCNHDRSLTSPEGVQGVLTLPLGAVTVNGGGGHVVTVQEVAQHISHALGLDEDQGQADGIPGLAGQDVEEDAALVGVLNVLDLLGDILAGRTDTADAKEDVVLQEITGEHLNITREGGGEHESLPLLDAGHVLALDNTTNLGLETHVQHAISFIEDEVLDVGKADPATFDEIDETTWGSREEITAFLDLAKLLVDIGATVDYGGANPGAISELAGLLVNLRDKLASGGEDEGGGVGLAASAVRLSRGIRDRRRALGEGGREDGEKETTSLSGTGLSGERA